MTHKPGMLVATNLRDQAARTIRAKIISGELKPGQLYAIGQLAEELGVSATPIREALLDSAKEGLISMARNRGFSVRVMSDHDLDEIVELRRMIEVPAVQQIAHRRLLSDDSELREISARAEAAASSGDWVAFLEFDRAFHLGVLSHLGNERLVVIVGSLRDQGRLYGLDRIAGTSQLLDSTREHDQLLDAIISGDGTGAASIMSNHLDHARGLWSSGREGKDPH